MQSQLFPSARQLFLTGALDWLAGSMRAVLLADSYVPTFTESNLSDIPSAVRISISALMLSRTAVNGIAGGVAVNLGTILSGTLVSKAVIYKDTGVEATSTLIAFIGDDGLVNQPFVPIGLEYFIYPNTLDGGFFRI